MSSAGYCGQGAISSMWVPAAGHLWEMKQVLYDVPYPNEERATPYEGFAYKQIIPVDFPLHLTSQADMQALFGMTPYAWKTPRTGRERLARADQSWTARRRFAFTYFSAYKKQRTLLRDKPCTSEFVRCFFVSSFSFPTSWCKKQCCF